MIYQHRDSGIQQIKTRKNHACYGMGLGIMILDDVYPGFPGDVRNASAFPYPIQYEIVEGIDIKQLLWHQDKSPCLALILKAAARLERMGCRAIQQRLDLPVFSWGTLLDYAYSVVAHRDYYGHV